MYESHSAQILSEWEFRPLQVWTHLPASWIPAKRCLFSLASSVAGIEHTTVAAHDDYVKTSGNLSVLYGTVYEHDISHTLTIHAC